MNSKRLKLRIQLRDKYAEQLISLAEAQNMSPTQFIINLIKEVAIKHESSNQHNRQ